MIKIGSNDKNRPEYQREKMRQEELKRPFSSIHGSNLADLVGSFTWKGTLILIFLIIVILIIVKFVFS